MTTITIDTTITQINTTMMRDNSSSSKSIRNSFLNKLGIEKQQQQQKERQRQQERLPSRGSLLGKVNMTLQEPLKYQQEDERCSANNTTTKSNPLFNIFKGKNAAEEQQQQLSCSPQSVMQPPPSPSSGSKRRTRKQRRAVLFHEQVQVVPIPMRHEYSSRVQQKLWSNCLEIKQNAARNALEYDSEGWDYRTALEEENMYTCSVTGEKIHPVHVDPDFLGVA